MSMIPIKSSHESSHVPYVKSRMFILQPCQWQIAPNGTIISVASGYYFDPQYRLASLPNDIGIYRSPTDEKTTIPLQIRSRI